MMPNKVRPCADAIKTAIPPAIANLPRTSLIEQIVLTEIAACATRTNGSLAREVGMSARGIEAMLSRFRKNGWLAVDGKGRARRLIIMFPVEHNKECEGTTSAEHHIHDGIETNRQIQRRAFSPGEEISLRISLYENCMDATAYDAARRHVQAIRSVLETATGICEDKKGKWHQIVDDVENRCVVFAFAKAVAESVPAEMQRRLAIAVATASSSQLADLRERISRGLPTTELDRLLATAEQTSNHQYEH